MMPKSTATRRPAVDEQIALVHVGVKEAVPQRRAQEGPDEVAGQRGGSRPPRSDARGSASGTPSTIPSSCTRGSVRSQSTAARESRVPSWVLRHFRGAAASSRKSISIRTDAPASRRLDRRKPRSRGPALGEAGGEEHVREVAREAPLDAGRSTLTATGRDPRRPGDRAVDLGDRGGGDGLAESPTTASPACRRTPPRRPTASCRRHWRHAVLKASSSRATLVPTMSGRVARNWPSFT